jgi:hypothetical protein
MKKDKKNPLKEELYVNSNYYNIIVIYF